MKRAILLAVAFLAFATVTAAPTHAGAILGATSVTSPQGDFGGSAELANIINQTGLSATYTSGITDFDTFTAATTHEDLSGTGFTGTESSGPQQFTFDLGLMSLIDGLAIWNTASVGAITSFRVLYDTDADFGNGTSGELLGSTPLGAAGPAQVFSFGSVSTRYIHVEGLTSLEPPDYYGLGEVAFRSAGVSPIPEPSTLISGGIAVGLMAVAGLRRRRTRSAD